MFIEFVYLPVSLWSEFIYLWEEAFDFFLRSKLKSCAHRPERTSLALSMVFIIRYVLPRPF